MKMKYRRTNPSIKNHRKKRPIKKLPEMEMIILSHSINIHNMSIQAVDEKMRQHIDSVEHFLDKGENLGIVVKNLYVPVTGDHPSKIDLIYPSENYLEALNPLGEIDRYKRKVRIFKFLENLENEQEENNT